MQKKEKEMLSFFHLLLKSTITGRKHWAGKPKTNIRYSIHKLWEWMNKCMNTNLENTIK